MKWIEQYPVAWRVALIVFCFLLMGYFEADDRELLQQLDPVNIGEAQ